jgi:hypothetical protein
MQKIIEFENKVALNENSDIPEINKITDDNINEIKSIVNGSLQGTNAMGSIVVDDVKCRNLLPNTISTQTTNGVTITKNNDGSITLNGTATAGITLNGYFTLTLKAGTYTHSINNTAPVGLYLSLNNINATMIGQTGAEQKVTFTITEDTTYQRYVIFISSGMTFNNFKIYPQLEAGSTPTTYTPYKNFDNTTIIYNLDSYIASGLTIDSSTLVSNDGIAIFDFNISKSTAYSTNTNITICTLPEALRPKTTIVGSCTFHSAGSNISAGYIVINTNGVVFVRTSTSSENSCMGNITYSLI